MVRSPHPAKPFHFGPFVSLQFLIFMIAPPDITPTSGPDLAAAPNSGGKKWTGLINKVGRLERQRRTPRFRCMSEEYLHGNGEDGEDAEGERQKRQRQKNYH